MKNSAARQQTGKYIFLNSVTSYKRLQQIGPDSYNNHYGNPIAKISECFDLKP
jgi:hypothetical protein